MRKKKYYFITVCQRLERDNNWIDTGIRKCKGFFADKDLAIRCVEDNVTDLFEGVYHYAIVEEYEEGIQQITGYKKYFKYDQNTMKYESIREPIGYEYFVGFALS